MKSILRMITFHIATLAVSLFLSLFISLSIGGIISGFLPKGLLTDSNGHMIFIPIFILVILFYVIKYKTLNIENWSNPELDKGLILINIGHLGPAFCTLAIYVMTKGGAGSGVVLVPAIIWSGYFYAKGIRRTKPILLKSQ